MDLPPVDKAIELLRAEVTSYPFDIRHYVPDRVLYDLAIDVLEHAIAVQLLAKSEVPRAAYSNARSAFESVQDLTYLTGAPADYDLKGCCARAWEVIDNEDIQKRFARANLEAGLAPVEVQDAEAVVLKDAQGWEELALGAGRVLRTAFELVRASPNHQRHWSGLGRRELAEAVSKLLEAEAGYGAIHDALYGAISAHTHARPRSSARSVTHDDSGSMTIGSTPADTTVPSDLAAFACVGALHALQKRRTFFRAA